MTSAGFTSSLPISSCSRMSAVGALPTAKISGPSSLAACSIETTARVTPRSFASHAMSGSAMRQSAFAPSFVSDGLLMPESAMFVSVTMVAPLHRAALACSITSGENARLSA